MSNLKVKKEKKKSINVISVDGNDNMIRLIHQDEMIATSQWKEITKAYKYEMKPTKKQEVESYRTINTCKDLYNLLLGHRKDAYDNGGWSITYKDQQDQLPGLRNKNNDLGESLRKVYEQVEQNVADRVDVAYQRFYDRVHENKENNVRTKTANKLSDDGKYLEPGHPRFKNRNRYKSFTFPQYGNGCNLISIEDRDKKKKDKKICKNSKKQDDKRSKKRGIVRLSGIGYVVFIKHRDIGEIKDKKTGNKIIIPYVIKTVTIKKEIDKWFVVFTIETFVEIDVPVVNKPIDLNRITGIDLNLENYAALDGKKIVPKKYLRESEKKLAKEQRRLSRKKRYHVIDKDGNVLIDKRTGKKIKYSKNGEKQKMKVAKVHRKIANQRENFGHEISNYSVDNYDLLVFENLDIDDMRQNRIYAKSISDAAWYQTQMFTKYKAEWAGKIVDFIDPKNTTQNCCYCGNIVHKEIWERTHSCPFCGLVIDRDYNSQIVILKRSKYYIDIFKKNNISMEDDVLRRISMCKGIFQDKSENKKFVPEEIGSIPEKVKRKINRRKINKNKITPATGEPVNLLKQINSGGACASSPNRDTMIQEALSDKGGIEDIENMISQAPAFRRGS